MSKIPTGNFTIVNSETGRCLRVRLGRTQDVGDYKEGTKYLQYVTDKPALELGSPDNSPATVWSFSTLDDGQERQPFNQFANFAVTEYQNIGNFCVWMYTSSLSEEEDLRLSRTVFESKLNDLPADVRTQLGKLIPEEWKTWQTKDYGYHKADWERVNDSAEAQRAWLEAYLEAWAADEEPLSAEKLAHFKAIREQVIEDDLAEENAGRDQMAEPKRRNLPEGDRALLEEIGQQPRGARVDARSKGLYPAARKRRKAAMELEWQRRAPVQALERWHFFCAFLEFEGDGGIGFTSPHYKTDEDRKIIDALRAYMGAAAKEGVKPSVVSSSDAWTALSGCGRSRGKGSTYRWVYDGTHIYGADSKTMPSERTYWTDDNGRLVGKNKGGSGQTWTLAQWKPTPQKPDLVRAALLTGLFGPLGLVVNG